MSEREESKTRSATSGSVISSRVSPSDPISPSCHWDVRGRQREREERARASGGGIFQCTSCDVITDLQTVYEESSLCKDSPLLVLGKNVSVRE